MSDVITQMVDQIIVNQKVQWENKLRLVIKPKPRWMPQFVYKRLVNMILVQEKSCWSAVKL